MNKILLIFFCLATASAFSQKVAINGKVNDSNALPLASATVMLLNKSDSALVNFTVTDSEGAFRLKNIGSGNYRIQVTFIGYRSYIKNVSVSDSDVQLGVISLLTATKELDELVIEADRVPVIVKKDTIEFNAASFKTKANASVEDLLKKLPGLEVGNDGTVKAQGEDVQRVTVDGREFFGRDPKLATKNLPADAVDKVQVFNKKSDQAIFTGIDDGQREKTINLELKEEKRNGAFGSLMGGVGTSDRFESKASINRFTKKKQFSFLGMGNNINEQGFSMEDYMNFSGSSQQMMGRGGAMRIEVNESNPNGVPLNMGEQSDGITTSYAGGINFNKDFNPKLQTGGSYFYNHMDQDVNFNLNRINYLPSGTYTFNQASRQLTKSNNHRLNLMVDHKIDSVNSLKFNASVAASERETNTFSQSETFDEVGDIQNESNRTTKSKTDGVSFNSNLLYRHKFPRKGRSFSSNILFGINDYENDGQIGSLNQFYTGTSETRNIAQSNSQSNQTLSYGITSSYTEPLGGRKYLEMNYTYGVNSNDVNRSVWDVSGSQQSFDSLLSNKYTSKYVYNRPGLNLRLIRQKFNVLVGASWQSTNLDGDLIYQNVRINKSFDNVLPVVRFNYDFTNFKRLGLDYETSMQEPTIQELQPVLNNSDPLNLSVGNPDLRPGYSHKLRGSFTLFDPGTFINVFSFLTATYTTDAISASQEVDENLVRTTRPVNVRDNYSVDATFHFGFPIKEIKSRIGIRTSVVTNNGITLLNSIENSIQRQTLGAMLRYSFTLEEIYSLDLSASIQQQKSHYDFNISDQRYLNKTYEAESILKFLKSYQLSSKLRFLDYSSQTTGFNQTVPLLDISVSRFLLKNNTGELKLGINNLLDRNVSISQTASTNYLEQRTSNNLGRYFMVSFTYALNKQLNPMAGTKGHMIRR